jgi:hypothetical protein
MAVPLALLRSQSISFRWLLGRVRVALVQLLSSSWLFHLEQWTQLGLVLRRLLHESFWFENDF